LKIIEDLLNMMFSQLVVKSSSSVVNKTLVSSAQRFYQK